MIFVRLLKLKVVLPQLINKSFVHLAAVNILVFLAICRTVYAVWDLHEVYISCSIAYKNTVVVYSLVTDILIEVHIVVLHEKPLGSGFL